MTLMPGEMAGAAEGGVEGGQVWSTRLACEMKQRKEAALVGSVRAAVVFIRADLWYVICSTINRQDRSDLRSVRRVVTFIVVHNLF